VLVGLVARTLAALRDTARFAATDRDAPPAERIRAALESTAAAWRDHGRSLRVAADNAAVVPEIDAMWGEVLDEFAAALRIVLVSAGVPDGPAPLMPRRGRGSSAG
jgi:TetR/AcrR family transcriptional regulator, ethionamide resistance regulator